MNSTSECISKSSNLYCVKYSQCTCIIDTYIQGAYNYGKPGKLREFLPHPRHIGGRGIVFDQFLCLYVSFFVSLLARLRENGWTDLHEIFREGAE